MIVQILSVYLNTLALACIPIENESILEGCLMFADETGGYGAGKLSKSAQDTA